MKHLRYLSAPTLDAMFRQATSEAALDALARGLPATGLDKNGDLVGSPDQQRPKVKKRRKKHLSRATKKINQKRRAA